VAEVYILENTLRPTWDEGGDTGLCHLEEEYETKKRKIRENFEKTEDEEKEIEKCKLKE
jgi:hypothetical protein